MAPASSVHHHRSTTKAPQKPFKSRHSTKSSLKELSKGKIDGAEKGHRRTPHQQVMSKLDRRNQARQKQQIKHQENAKATSVFSGRHGAPRIVAVVPLCPNGDAVNAVRALDGSLNLQGEVRAGERARTNVDLFKQKIEWILVGRELMHALDACRIADFVMLILSPHQEVDELGETMLRAIEGQGVSTVVTVAQDLDKIDPPKRRPKVLASLKSYVTHFLPDQERVYSLDSVQECTNVIRSICTSTPKGVRWREDRSWMLVEDIAWPTPALVQASDDQTIQAIITGVIRGRGLKADRLVHLGDWGNFQIEKITAAPLPSNRKSRGEQMTVDHPEGGEVLGEPTADQDALDELAPEETTMRDADEVSVSEAVSERKGVLLDDHHYFSDDETHLPAPPKRLPKGTSSNQAAWILDDIPVSDSEDDDGVDDDGDLPMHPPALPQDGLEGLDQATRREPTETATSEAPQSEMFLDPTPEEEAGQLAAFRSRKQNEALDDLEFPDEIELQPNVLARERLVRYRGLKSLRTSAWEMDEDRAHEPAEWRRLLQTADPKAAKNQATREALVGGIEPGTRVHVHLRKVPLRFREQGTRSPLAMVSLLRHEHKRAVVNFSISISSDYPLPISSKEELILQCGPRRLVIHPLFSQPGHTPNNVHKFARYLHPGRTAVATFIAPVTWGSVPTLIFKRRLSDMEGDVDRNALELVGTGTSLAPDHDRVLAKRVILTGHPYKIHKKLVTIRYMFFNVEDINWFKALQLWTKRGRSGYIKESLGTHGYFKATFDAKINPQDSVGVSLYKRVFPRAALAWEGHL
ncbi:MAG: hypothetical protein M1832_001663 [Thelocarpon impressellum]|nr:MAG: hypothetical protein M1832_001663 [Thelocarpon impressellum]